MLRRLGQSSPDTPEPAAQVAFPALDQPFLIEERPPGLRCYRGRASFYHPYALLQGMHLADDTLTLSFATAEVSVTGRGLHALYVHLSAHNVAAIIEQGERYAAGSEAPAHIHRITETLK